MLTVVIPTYNEELMVEKNADIISDVLANAEIVHELIYVDDGSSDRTWEIIQKVTNLHKNVRGIHFSRNFGKESAIMAGLNDATGDCCVVIDCDLQHPPEKIVEMYSLWEQGYEIVEGVKSTRGKERAFHAFAAKMFYKFISAAVGFDMSKASDFKLLDRKAVDSLIAMPERNAFFRALSSWIGFRSTTVSFDVQEREAGQSKWSTKALIRYAISNISSFSAAPMQIVTILGFFMLTVSIVLGCISLVQKIIGIAVEGFTTVILIQLFSSSIIMISLGIIGYYIAKIYEEIKARPRYIVSCRCGCENSSTFEKVGH